MFTSKPHTVSRKKPAVSSYILELPFMVDGGPLGSNPPQLAQATSALRRSNAVRHAESKKLAQPSPTILTQADIEYAAVPNLQGQENHRQRRSRVSNFSRLMDRPGRPGSMARYYTLALSADDHVALARGEKNHNSKPWEPNKSVSYNDSNKHLAPTNVHVGTDKQLYAIPVIIITEGQNESTHKHQLYCQYYGLRSSYTPDVSTSQPGPVVPDGMQVFNRSASSGSYDSNNRRRGLYRASGNRLTSGYRTRSPFVHDTISFQPSKYVTFDNFLTPHRSGKGEVYRDEELDRCN